MRLIDADALIDNKLERMIESFGIDFGRADVKFGTNEIEHAPTVEAELIKHGRWELEDDDWNTYKCSVCGELWTLNAGTPQERNMNYCCKCGAKMEGTEK